MKAKLIRAWQDERVTLGMLKVQGVDHDPIYTLENPWIANRKKVSCIPMGIYNCEPFSGTHYKNVWELKNVPDRSAILIHWGNWEKNTEGCILLGCGSGILRDEPAVSDSKRAINIFRGLVGDNSFELEIVDDNQVSLNVL